MNRSNYWIACGGCNIGELRFQVQTWDEQQGRLVDRQLALLPAAGPGQAVRSLNNEAVRLRDALAGIIKVYTDALIGAISGGRRGDGSVILNHVYYGDSAGAVDVLRRYDVAQDFNPDSPVSEELGPIVSSALANIVAKRTTAWLEIRPELAAAHFLREWAYALQGTAVAAAAAVRRAVSLAPDDDFYRRTDAYLTPQGQH